MHIYYMKLAVAVFNDIVSPRLDAAESVLIYDIKDKLVKNKENYKIFFDRSYYLIALLEQEKVSTILCGSCPPFLLRILEVHGIDVKWGYMGDPDNLVKSLIGGKPKNLKIKILPKNISKKRIDNETND